MKKITHSRLKNQIVCPLLVALHAECYNILNPADSANVPSMQHSFHQFNHLFKKTIRKIKKVNYKGFVTFISPIEVSLGVPLIFTNSTL